MKSLFTLLLTISIGLTGYSQVSHATATSSSNTANSPSVASHPPIYPGGKKALVDFVMKHIELPAEIIKSANGVLKAKLAINEKGMVEDIKLIKGTSNKEVNDEVLKVLKLTKWKPAENEKGKPIADTKIVSITFGKSNKKSGCKGKN